jgi:hypothetical protein
MAKKVTAQAKPAPSARHDAGDAKAQPDISPEEKGTIDRVTASLKAFSMYPVASNEAGKEEALAVIKREYGKARPRLRQVMLYMLNERVYKFSEFRAPKNFDQMKKKFPNAEPSQVRVRVYNEMFDYSSSIEGIIDIIFLLSELGDNDSAKLLANQFSFLCSYEGSEGARMLRNAVADALGKSSAPYALRALAYYAQYTDNEMLGGRLYTSILAWKEKLPSLKLPKKEEDELKKIIDSFSNTTERQEWHYR